MSNSTESLLQGYSILVVEDEPILLTLFSSAITRHAGTLSTAVNGKLALEQIHTHKPDLIVLDLWMPVMTGYDLLGILQDDIRLRDIPVLVVSNSGQVDDLNRAYDLGAKEVLIKTDFEPEQLVHKVYQLLQFKIEDSSKATAQVKDN